MMTAYATMAEYLGVSQSTLRSIARRCSYTASFSLYTASYSLQRNMAKIFFEHSGSTRKVTRRKGDEKQSAIDVAKAILEKKLDC